MDRTAIILAGGSSERFGADKGLVKLANKPLILHVIERVRDLVDEVIVSVKSNAQLSLYRPLMSNCDKIVVDMEGFPACPLTGALTGLANSGGEYSILLPCDTPFISRSVIDLLFEIAVGVDAVIPRWPNGYIEPLQAVYKTSSALKSARESLERGEIRMQSMISRLRRVRYLSTLVIGEIDQKMLTFFNINTPIDLKKAEALIKRGVLDE
ncbi:molybdenum cofactor guanylyltransferase [Candidatus Bathyarchaeota archaeon]|nr:molybdenum cofactor guanylyltransferase [Candidatus Bathyarchaeota archaeon]